MSHANTMTQRFLKQAASALTNAATPSRSRRQATKHSGRDCVTPGTASKPAVRRDVSSFRAPRLLDKTLGPLDGTLRAQDVRSVARPALSRMTRTRVGEWMVQHYDQILELWAINTQRVSKLGWWPALLRNEPRSRAFSRTPSTARAGRRAT